MKSKNFFRSRSLPIASVHLKIPPMIQNKVMGRQYKNRLQELCLKHKKQLPLYTNEERPEFGGNKSYQVTLLYFMNR